MATVGIWSIKKRLDMVINYTTNEEKTSCEEFTDLHKLLKYVEADYKTEQQKYVSALNCGVSTALNEMKITKEHWNKTNGILGYHCVQSFKGRELSPNIAHEIGLKFAEEIWGDEFEVIVSTHLNTNNLHNHFVINSVSMKTGKKYYDTRTSYARLRAVNDELCIEYGISVLKEKTCSKSGINYASYYEKYKERDNYFTDTKADIDRAILQANSYRDFENILRASNYELIYRAGKLSVRKSPYKKNIRVHRAFGEDYTREVIENRIKTEFIAIDMSEGEVSKRKELMKHSNYKKEKAKGIYGLYLHYCYLLKVYPVEYPKRVITPEIKADVKLMEQISKQTIFLVENVIKTDEELLDFKKKNNDELKNKITTRANLWKRYNRSDNEEKKIMYRNEINSLSKSIKELRREVILCDGVIERLDIVESNIEKHYKMEKGREKNV